MTLANFRRFGKVTSENEKVMSLTTGFESTEHVSFKYIDGYTVRTYGFRGVHFFYQ